jgi:hypothetical protein
MEARRAEHKISMSAYRRDQREMQALVHRMLGKGRASRKPLKTLRREVAKQLSGVSVSRMIIEAR